MKLLSLFWNRYWECRTVFNIYVLDWTVWLSLLLLSYSSSCINSLESNFKWIPGSVLILIHRLKTWWWMKIRPNMRQPFKAVRILALCFFFFLYQTQIFLLIDLSLLHHLLFIQFLSFILTQVSQWHFDLFILLIIVFSAYRDKTAKKTFS